MTTLRTIAVGATVALVAAVAPLGAPAGAHTQALGFTTTGVATGKDYQKIADKDGGGEPSIAAGPGRSLYVSFPSNKGASFYRSFNEGRSFSPGGIADTSSGDTSVNVDSSGAVYESNLDGNLEGDVYKSFDHGKTWPQKGRAETAVADDSSTGNPLKVDRQWVDAYIPPGKTTRHARVYITYHDFGPSQIWVNVSKDGGRTFSAPIDVLATLPQAQADSFCNTIPGGVKVVQSGPHAGRVYVAWLAADVATSLATGCNYTQMDTFHSVWIAWSDDEGQTWEATKVFDGGFGHDASVLFADLTLDRAGNPYLAFGDNLGKQWDMYVSASFNGGKSFNTANHGRPFRIPAGRGTHFFPAIAAGRPGRVDVAFIATPARIDTLPYGKPAPGGGAGDKWYLYVAQGKGLRSADPSWRVKRITPDPIHKGDVCTLGIFCVFPGSNRDLLDFIDATIDPHGRFHVAFTQDTKKHTGIYVANQTSGPRI